MKKTGEDYPCGPCPYDDGWELECNHCGAVLNAGNVVIDPCGDECEICQYCGPEKCPDCGEHVHCGGCI